MRRNCIRLSDVLLDDLDVPVGEFVVEEAVGPRARRRLSSNLLGQKRTPRHKHVLQHGEELEDALTRSPSRRSHRPT